MAQSVVSRRDFLKVSSTAGAGLMIGVFFPGEKALCGCRISIRTII
ncbi:MAG: hypothetical protein Ct9H300mP29_1220 [Candidatus Neomarinimicrobiota bacterium]|nr:MAG: hypothetical protein Ct9H300mP29_1220 [Candidatus Neomarinimicrobiota bacterium]